MSESFQIFFVTATLICLNKISPGREIDTINSELFCWKKNKGRLTVQFCFNILFDFQGSSQRLDVTSESESLSQAGNIPRTHTSQDFILVLTPGDNYSQGAASPISTPNIAKRKSVNDRSVVV